ESATLRAELTKAIAALISGSSLVGVAAEPSPNLSRKVTGEGSDAALAAAPSSNDQIAISRERHRRSDRSPGKSAARTCSTQSSATSASASSRQQNRRKGNGARMGPAVIKTSGGA